MKDITFVNLTLVVAAAMSNRQCHTEAACEADDLRQSKPERRSVWHAQHGVRLPACRAFAATLTLLSAVPALAEDCDCRRYQCTNKHTGKTFIYTTQEMQTEETIWCIRNSSNFNLQGDCRYDSICENDVCKCERSTFFGVVTAVTCFIVAAVNFVLFCFCCFKKNQIRLGEQSYVRQNRLRKVAPEGAPDGFAEVLGFDNLTTRTMCMPCVICMLLTGAGIAAIYYMSFAGDDTPQDAPPAAAAAPR